VTGVAAFLKALASILGSLSGLATVGRRFAAWVMRRRLRQVLASARRTHDWLDVLLAAYRPLGGCQVALLRTRNGGGLPTPGRPLYGDLVDCAQDHVDGVEPLRRQDWSGQELDGPYRDLVEEVHRRRSARVLTREMEPGLLRDAYESRRLMGALLWSVGHTPDGFLYVSVGFRGRMPGDVTAQLRDQTRRAITGLAKEQDAWLYVVPALAAARSETRRTYSDGRSPRLAAARQTASHSSGV
jgi:hypothetical protein